MVLMEPCGECGHTQEQWIQGADIDRGYECWHVSLSRLQMKPLLKALWQDDSPNANYHNKTS